MTAPAKKIRIRDPEFNRQRLIESAAELMAEKGLDGLSYKEVVARSQISRSGAYLHFAGKNELVDAVGEFIRDKLIDVVVNAEEGGNLYDRVLFTTKLVLEYPDAARIMLSDSLNGYGLGLADPLYNAIIKRIRRAKKEGTMDADLDAEVTTLIHIGSIFSTMLLAARHPTKSKDKIAHQFTKQWCAILTEGVM